MVASGEPIAKQILWISPNLPRKDRGGGDLRRWQMITVLARRGTTVTVWSETGNDSAHAGQALNGFNVTWVAPPPVTRGQAPPGSTRSAVRDLVAGSSWDSIVISYSYLAARHLDSLRKVAPATPILVDLGDARFHRSTEEEAEHANAGELDFYAMADGLITASETDTRFLLGTLPHIPGYSFSPLASDPPALPQASPEGPLVFWGNMAEPANANAVGWWMDEIAGEVSRRTGKPLPLQLRGPGTEIYKSVWGASGKLSVGAKATELQGARAMLFPIRHGSETAAIALAAGVNGIPVIATSAAVTGLEASVRAHLCLGETASELAELIVQLMTEDEAWQRQRDQIFAAAGAVAKRRGALEQDFADWISRRQPIRVDAAAH